MKLLIPLLIILIIIISLNNFSFFHGELNDTNLIKKLLYNGDNLNGYRLSDLICYPDFLTKYNGPWTFDHLYKYNNTIGVKYVKQKFPELKNINSEEDKNSSEFLKFEEYIKDNYKSISVDIDLLNKIMDQFNYKPEIKLDNQTLILHIRVGDILCKKDEGKDYPKEYAKKGNVVWWNSVIDYIKNNGITKVVILSGSHFNECLEESSNYLLECSDMLKKNNVKISFHLGNHPDNDLLFCRKAKHFITTGGGYGYFLGNIIKSNGGNFVLYNDNIALRKEYYKLFK